MRHPEDGRAAGRPPVTWDDLQSATARMERFPKPWCVAGGWAIDLFVGRVTREHSDIELAVFRADQRELVRHLLDCQLQKAIPDSEGGGWKPWGAEEWLALPIHQLLARPANGTPTEFELFLMEWADGTWTFRRHSGIQRSACQIFLRSRDGLPLLAPEIQL